MRLSKIAIGISTAVLAGIGAFASAKTFRNNTYWFKSGIQCIATNVPIICTATPGVICTSPTTAKPLFLNNACKIPMYKL
jgi:hypothetical protein